MANRTLREVRPVSAAAFQSIVRKSLLPREIDMPVARLLLAERHREEIEQTLYPEDIRSRYNIEIWKHPAF